MFEGDHGRDCKGSPRLNRPRSAIHRPGWCMRAGLRARFGASSGQPGAIAVALCAG
ncbi:hypothetical protein SALB1_2274 [Salinisphaera sp. LB1]|nr:hypothetical protein SALB1_2274 [Salinisphaera sp. LB1]